MASPEAWIAQSVEHQTFNLRVQGSSPCSGDCFKTRIVDMYCKNRGAFSEVSSEMGSYGLRKTSVRKDLRLIHERLKMGSYTAKVFSAVRIEDEDS